MLHFRDEPCHEHEEERQANDRDTGQRVFEQVGGGNCTQLSLVLHHIHLRLQLRFGCTEDGQVVTSTRDRGRVELFNGATTCVPFVRRNGNPAWTPLADRKEEGGGCGACPRRRVRNRECELNVASTQVGNVQLFFLLVAVAVTVLVRAGQLNRHPVRCVLVDRRDAEKKMNEHTDTYQANVSIALLLFFAKKNTFCGKKGT